MGGKVFVGADTAQAEFDVLGLTGGEKAHLLLSSESGVKPHAHYNGSGAGGANVGGVVFAGSTSTSATANATAEDAASAHNNLQPYFVGNWLIRVI
jgi:hypothetical protein